MIIIRHAWLNLKRNRSSHLKIGGMILLILLIIFSMLKIYRTETAYFSDYRAQAAVVVKGVKDLNQTEQAKNLKPTDYEKLKNLSYVKKSQLNAQGIIPSTLVQPKGNGQPTKDYTSFPPEKNQENYLAITMLDKDSLKELLAKKTEKLKGTAPIDRNTCVISRDFAKENKLKLNDTLSLGAKGQEQKVTITGIAEFANAEGEGFSSPVLINWDTGAAMQESILPTYSMVMFQLTGKKELKKFVKVFKESESFEEYSLIGQNWSLRLFQSFNDTLDLLFNGLIVALILGIVVIALIYQRAINRRQDFYTLHLMGMDRRTLALSGSLESTLLTFGIGAGASIVSLRLSRWITGEWLINLQRELSHQEPFVEWVFPKVNEETLEASRWFDHAELLFLGVCLITMLLLINFRIVKIVSKPLQEVSK